MSNISAGCCSYTGAPCPALKGLIGRSRTASAEAQEWTDRLAPCPSCRVAFAARAASLGRLRLGKREREILMGAAAQEVFVVTAPGMGRSLSAARRRAAHTLVRAGLATEAASHAAAPDAPRGQTRAAVSLTQLGLYVLAAYGRFLERSQAVRWDRPRANVELPGRKPEDLVGEALERTRSELHATLDELKRVLIAAVARPVRDPALLDSVTRHLQAKAQGLRDLIEPAGPRADLAAAAEVRSSERR